VCIGDITRIVPKTDRLARRRSNGSKGPACGSGRAQCGLALLHICAVWFPSAGIAAERVPQHLEHAQ